MTFAANARNEGLVKALTLGALFTLAALTLAPVSRADMLVGNYELEIVGRYDFHIWVWAITRCHQTSSFAPVPGRANVSAQTRPIAKAFPYEGDAQLASGRYTLTVDVPDGLRLPPLAYWHEHAFSDYGQMLFLVSVSPVAVELTAHNGVWQPGLARMYLLEGEHFTAVVPRAQQRAELANEFLWRSTQSPKP
jgi:hypothetical protein